MAKIRVVVSLPKALEVPEAYRKRIAKYTQTLIIKQLNKDGGFAAEPRTGKGKTKGLGIEPSVIVKIVEGKIKVTLKAAITNDDKMFAFPSGSGNTMAGKTDKENAGLAEAVLDMVVPNTMKLTIPHLRKR